MWRHYVYIHRRADSGEPFYVGKGSHRLRDKKRYYERAYATDSRSKHWRSIVSKHGFSVDIIANCKNDDAAQKLEMAIIAKIGRRDLGNGNLVNLTDGGDGHAGIVASDDLRKKRSKNARGQRSAEWVQSIRNSRKNGGNGGVVRLGDKLPKTWVDALSASKLGAKNPYYGKPTAVSRKVINKSTGKIYDSIARAAKAENINAKTLYQYLDGTRTNKTSLECV